MEKELFDPGAELELLWGWGGGVVWNSDNHSRHENTTAETTRLGVTGDFIQNWVLFPWSLKWFPEISHLEKKIDLSLGSKKYAI